MPFTVGVSTGFYHIAKDPSLLGMASKIAFGATVGVQFVQIDLETTAEFKEPQLKYKVKRVINDIGVKEVGLHGEISGEHMALDSALRRIWEDTQSRLCEGLKGAKDMGFFYINIHFSGRPWLLFEEDRYQTQGYFYPVVGPDGKSLSEICSKSKAAKKIIANYISTGILEREVDLRKIQLERVNSIYRNLIDKRRKEILAEIDKDPESINFDKRQKQIAAERVLNGELPGLEHQAEREGRITSDEVYEYWKKSRYNRYLLENSEIGAYEAVATAMIESSDPLWKNICGGNEPLEAYEVRHGLFNAAVAAKYLEGHITAKTHWANKEILGGLSIKEFCEQNKIMLLLEVPAVEIGGAEGKMRLFDPRHCYHLIKKLSSPYIKICLDFEHMLSHKLDPDKVIDDLPGDAGKNVFLFHLGKPVPYIGTTHAALYLGSRSQEIIYRWLYKLKQKGMEKAYILFERGGGQTPLEVFRDSVQSMRQMAEFLEKGTKPDDLPPEFYGISTENKAIFARQLVAIREHASDPLSGMLMIPEETHTFLGRHAVERGKAEEWKKGQFR